MHNDGNSAPLNFDENDFFEAHEFDHVRLRDIEVCEKEFYKCRFSFCDLYKVRFVNCEFEKCEFESSDLSLLEIKNTRLTSVEFVKCKAIGITWPAFKMPGDYNFDQCRLDNSIVMGINWQSIKMINCSAREIDFSETNLNKGIFKATDFLHSRFVRANLSFADFSEAVNYSIDPTLNKLKKTTFSFPEVTALLNNFDIIIK